MKCDVHPDRGGILFIDLPSIGIRRWGCLECRMNFDMKSLNYSPRKAAREGLYSSYDDRSTDGRLLRHEYDGTFKRNTIDRSKE